MTMTKSEINTDTEQFEERNASVQTDVSGLLGSYLNETSGIEDDSSSIQSLEHYVSRYKEESAQKYLTEMKKYPPYMMECSAFEQKYLSKYVNQHTTLIVHGLPETAGEDTISVFIDLTSKILVLPIGYESVYLARRMVKYGSTENRPIFVWLTSSDIVSTLLLKSEFHYLTQLHSTIVDRKVTFELPKPNDISFVLKQEEKFGFQHYMKNYGENLIYLFIILLCENYFKFVHMFSLFNIYTFFIIMKKIGLFQDMSEKSLQNSNVKSKVACLEVF